jgi:predicted MFS family arabinose efflux permease
MPYPSSALPSWNFSPAIFAAWLVGFLPLESSAIWIPAAQIHYNVSPVAVGVVASLQSITAALGATFIAPRLAKRSLREPLLVAMSVNLAAAVVTAALHVGFFYFVLLRIADAAGAGICIASAAMLASRTPKPSRSFAAMQFGQFLANMVVFGLSTRLVVEYGLAGLYSMLAVIMSVLLGIMFFSKGWPPAFVERRRLDGAAPRSVRVMLCCIAVALIYCGYIALLSNVKALGTRAGIDFAHVTMMLAIATPAGALGALISMLLAGRVRGGFVITAAGIGSAGFGLFLVFGGYSFAGLTASLCGIVVFIFVAFPSIYSGVAALDVTGRSASLTQAAQFLGPIVGPAAGAMIAVHSVTTFAALAGLLVTSGIMLGAAAVWPALNRQFAIKLSETDGSAKTLSGIA